MSTVELRQTSDYETPLVGEVRVSEHIHADDMSDFIHDLLELMIKYKIVKIDIAIDPFKLKEQEAQ